jgi:hypothetical protein
MAAAGEFEHVRRKRAAGKMTRRKRPDFLARLKDIYGGKRQVGGAELLAKERERS